MKTALIVSFGRLWWQDDVPKQRSGAMNRLNPAGLDYRNRQGYTCQAIQGNPCSFADHLALGLAQIS
jgi:hypothetical protein